MALVTNDFGEYSEECKYIHGDLFLDKSEYPTVTWSDGEGKSYCIGELGSVL